MSADNQKLYEQIKESLNIVDVIGERVKLAPSTRGFFGLCPFHSEKTASFHVYEDTQSYYCFGCHRGGDIFKFVMELEEVNFHEALEMLAQRAGIKLIPYERTKGAKSYNEILELATNFFTENLLGVQGTVARAYMERRHMDNSDIDRFSLGYSLGSWDSLVNYLRAEKINDKQILDLGLASHGTHGLYDKFRGRLIFPIRNVAGNIVAFGGRLIDGDGPKYINSPESVVYSKRKNLYLLNIARKTIKEKNRAILVEGYMDAVRLHKCGFTETIASLGTSLTNDQAKLLQRFANNCYICYDSDSAGQAATLRSMYILQEEGINVYTVSLPEGKDPDEFLSTNNNTPEMFEKILHEAKPLIIQHLLALKPELVQHDTKQAAVKELFEGLVKLNPDEVANYTAQISEATLMSPSYIGSKIQDPNNPGVDRKEKEKLANNFFRMPLTNKMIDSKFYEAECAVCSLLYHYSECRLSTTPQEIYDLMQTPTAKQTAYALLTDNPDILYKIWTNVNDTERLEILAAGDHVISTCTYKTVQDKWNAFFNEVKNIHNAHQQSYLMNSLKTGKADSSALTTGYQFWPRR